MAKILPQISQVYLFTLIVLIIGLCDAFNCDSVSSELYCDQLAGCSYSSADDSCKGQFIPDCSPPDCVFVDSSYDSDQSDGSAQHPYTTLNEAF